MPDEAGVGMAVISREAFLARNLNWLGNFEG